MEGEYNMLLHKGTVKRVLCVLMACVLMLAPATPVSAATARATTMKLEKKVGAVTLKTQSGTSLRITDGMRLYNGNSLATGKYSYAYISLDSSKAVKLDQSSSATLRQNGRSLELLLRAGSSRWRAISASAWRPIRTGPCYRRYIFRWQSRCCLSAALHLAICVRRWRSAA